MRESESPLIGAGDALFLDFDGTLAPLGPDREAIRLPEGLDTVLTRLASRLDGALAVISGRGLADLSARVPAGLWRLGAHGLEVAPPDGPPEPAPAPLPEGVLAPVARLAGAMPGLVLERKGAVAALHYRARPDAAARCLAAAREAASRASGLKVQPGRMVVEIKPEAADKGRALAAMMARPGWRGRRPVAVGDDATDEDMIRAAQMLGGLGIHVGDGDSAASMRLPDPAAVAALLARAAAKSS